MEVKKILSKEWAVGFRDRGQGYGDFGIVIKDTNVLVLECPNREIAHYIVGLHNLALIAATIGGG